MVKLISSCTDEASERPPTNDPPPHARCMPCLRQSQDRADAYLNGDLRAVGECNREILRHPHLNRPIRTGRFS